MSVTGTIGVISGELARYAAFNQCLLGLDKPEGAVIKWLSGTCDVAANRNRFRALFASLRDSRARGSFVAKKINDNFRLILGK